MLNGVKNKQLLCVSTSAISSDVVLVDASSITCWLLLYSKDNEHNIRNAQIIHAPCAVVFESHVLEQSARGYAPIGTMDVLLRIEDAFVPNQQ